MRRAVSLGSAIVRKVTFRAVAARASDAVRPREASGAGTGVNPRRRRPESQARGDRRERRAFRSATPKGSTQNGMAPQGEVVRSGRKKCRRRIFVARKHNLASSAFGGGRCRGHGRACGTPELFPMPRRMLSAGAWNDEGGTPCIDATAQAGRRKGCGKRKQSDRRKGADTVPDYRRVGSSVRGGSRPAAKDVRSGHNTAAKGSAANIKREFRSVANRDSYASRCRTLHPGGRERPDGGA